jgi:hypothetical protein
MIHKTEYEKQLRIFASQEEEYVPCVHISVSHTPQFSIKNFITHIKSQVYARSFFFPLAY